MPEPITPDELALMDAMFAAADRKAERRRQRKADKATAPEDRPAGDAE